MSTTSHSNTLLPTSPQLIPGMSVSVCIDLNSFASRRAALDGPADESVFRGEAMVCVVRSVVGGTGGVVGGKVLVLVKLDSLEGSFTSRMGKRDCWTEREGFHGLKIHSSDKLIVVPGR
jgi:hypothetical protein